MKSCNFNKFCRSIGVTKKIKKNCVLKSAMQILGTPSKYCNLKTSKMGISLHFISTYNKQTKTTTLAKARTQKEDSK
jgi:hypothetical protein